MSNFFYNTDNDVSEIRTITFGNPKHFNIDYCMLFKDRRKSNQSEKRTQFICIAAAAYLFYEERAGPLDRGVAGSTRSLLFLAAFVSIRSLQPVTVSHSVIPSFTI